MKHPDISGWDGESLDPCYNDANGICGWPADARRTVKFGLGRTSN